jgi:uncharacterized membrane protein
MKTSNEFEKCRSGQDIVNLAKSKGANVTRVSNRWVAIEGEHGKVHIPDTPTHLPKSVRSKYAAMLKWIGIALILVLVMGAML